jgi:ABC-type polysaccharide/polyol phosphate transport system ATPase subunit
MNTEGPMDIAKGAVVATGLTKAYRLYGSPLDRLKESLHLFKKRFHTLFYALNGLDLEVAPGESVGIIGKNGAGKSTLLKLVTGVITPTAGTVAVGGTISALLELGAGFNPELTGRENILFSATLAGRTKKEALDGLDEVIAFAELGEFIDQPVKNYSSGMYVRLAFAAAIHVDPDILIVDEALSVGDIRFQQKCLRTIEGFQQRGKTILFVSHDMNAILAFCHRVVWIMDGKVFRQGATKDVVRDFISYMSYGELPPEDADRAAPEGDAAGAAVEAMESTEGRDSFGNGAAVIEQVSLSLAGGGERVTVLTGGETISLRAVVTGVRPMQNPLFGFFVTDEKGNPVTGSNSSALGQPLAPLLPGQRRLVETTFTFPFLRDGSYPLSVAIGDGTYDDHQLAHWVHDASVVQVISHDKVSHSGHLLLLKDVRFQESAL